MVLRVALLALLLLSGEGVLAGPCDATSHIVHGVYPRRHQQLRRLPGAALRERSESIHRGLLYLLGWYPWCHGDVLGGLHRRVLLRRLAAAAAARAGGVRVQRGFLFLQPVRLQSQRCVAVRRWRWRLCVCWHSLLLVQRDLPPCRRLPVPIWIGAQEIGRQQFRSNERRRPPAGEWHAWGASSAVKDVRTFRGSRAKTSVSL